MEKLQPLITHRFWVLFGLGILVPLVSWMIYNGDMNDRIEGRLSEVKSAFDTAGKGADAPNQKWVKMASEVNTGHNTSLQRASQQLWLEQQDQTSMFWPKRMQPYVENLPYGGEITGPQASSALTIYKREYDRQHENRVLSRITQYAEGRGLMEVDTSMVHRVPEGMWSGRLPTWTEVWHAQEDEWLVAQLLESLENVNRKARARTIAEAPIRQLHELALMGGNMDGAKPATSGGGAGGYPGGGYPGAGGGFDPGASLAGSGGGAGGLTEGGGGSLGGGGGSKSVIKAPELDFDETEEFGSPAGTAATTATLNIDPNESQMGASRGGGRRYVSDKEGAPYKTRGFKIRLTIHQDSLPAVLAELTNSDWPVEIVRVHWEAANEGGRKAGPIGSGGLGAGSKSGSGSLAGSSLAGSGSGGSGFAGFGGAGGGGGYEGLAGGGGEEERQKQNADDGGYPGGYPGAGGGSLAGSGSSTTTTRTEEAADPLEAALSDPYLSNVVIAGLITIFKVDEAEAAKMRELAKQKLAADTTPAGEEPAAEGAPTDPAGAAGEAADNTGTPAADADNTTPAVDTNPTEGAATAKPPAAGANPPAADPPGGNTDGSGTSGI